MRYWSYNISRVNAYTRVTEEVFHLVIACETTRVTKLLHGGVIELGGAPYHVNPSEGPVLIDLIDPDELSGPPIFSNEDMTAWRISVEDQKLYAVSLDVQNQRG
jgi:hypothetical protein